MPMEKTIPHEPHFYLAFIAVAPRLQGLGLGSALLEATLARVDAAGAPAYLENSNPRNLALYERLGLHARPRDRARAQRRAAAVRDVAAGQRRQTALDTDSLP